MVVMSKELNKSPDINRQMPTPQFLDIPSPFESGNKPIGVITKSPIDGKEKPFVWFNNLTGNSLNNRFRRHEVAEYLTRIVLTMNVGIILGPAIDIKKSMVSGKIKLERERGDERKFGYYVDASERVPMFGFKFHIDSIEDLVERYYLAGKPNIYEETYRKIKTSLPRR